MHVPSPADTPHYSARQLLRQIRRRGGRIYRMREVCVFVLTDSGELADWLLKQGGRSYLPHQGNRAPDMPLGGYRRAPDAKTEWDIYIHVIKVKGEQSIWEAAGDVALTVEATDFA